MGWRGEICEERLEGRKGVTSGGNNMNKDLRTRWSHRCFIPPAAVASGLQISLLWWTLSSLRAGTVSSLLDTPEALAGGLSLASLTQPPTHSTSIHHPSIHLSIYPPSIIQPSFIHLSIHPSICWDYKE